MSTKSKPETQQDSLKPIKPRRPFLVSLILWVFLLWVVLGWLRFGRALTDRELILEWLSDEYFWYVIMAGLVWGLAGLPVIWGILWRCRWTPKLIWIAGVLYPMVYWLERLFLWAPSETRENWPFMLVLTLVWFGMVVLATRSARSRKFFQQKELRGD